ncbi:MAG: hypothetical protein JGK24_05730 [Microcoleus sp. PH2017_29_MFU_D_A]|nr:MULTISPECIES: hypothetical protein [unclassified Microcoleus]MCC3417226.1 hypothetical protein [Microcoleus sp. PH2017_07_MST_O_A]MCC3428646.1 hypothetical protein [Microcoleus sp. PH2017_04_SCI_O_A]MCC3441095.1 hypothetical protein [Microcoleus sp. PH2017_03_ELD_O_A]MCC3464993.1 hypothetical protein [Microcoleus sp. PH2017_06_SFM_O_A]MCC3490049.1 hypothetical protein [Microcoleus sp. PH2017_16_JOR_D_A]MCC3501658.1 hypothetical protein [Microcoleus sp. PH2017_19_SFW_U_A]
MHANDNHRARTKLVFDCAGDRLLGNMGIIYYNRERSFGERAIVSYLH